MNYGKRVKPVEILLVEDNPGDVRLMVEALKDGKVYNRLSTVRDGVEALAFLQQEGEYADAPQPDLILLDLNLPNKDGHETLREIKSHEELARIPVVVLTSSDATTDIVKTYDRHASCYIVKPVDLEQFMRIVQSIEDFWLTVVRLPSD